MFASSSNCPTCPPFDQRRATCLCMHIRNPQMILELALKTIMPCFWYRILSIPEIQFHSSRRTSLDAMWHEAHLEASCMRVASERAGHTCSHESFINIYILAVHSNKHCMTLTLLPACLHIYGLMQLVYIPAWLREGFSSETPTWPARDHGDHRV